MIECASFQSNAGLEEDRTVTNIIAFPTVEQRCASGRADDPNSPPEAANDSADVQWQAQLQMMEEATAYLEYLRRTLIELSSPLSTLR
ncbi:hypothetical protein FHT85_004964 [Rhizobium sp. BK312]|uniref:hypothetical protein n=1 Tax=Rhizobium sp. BK312 TaxID=2587080 RepID=UPI000DD5EF65|nr:hypothetical protein [Rhizobium sp. BK312]MBB3427955.1 hypothetical protein [Rhizobium sp. BK312]